MDERSRTLWARVCATVNRLGSPRSPRPRPVVFSSEPNVIDLHGLTVQEAYVRTKEFLSRGSANTVTVITGKSGVIRAEFPVWLAGFDKVASYREQNGGGAFEITLHKQSEKIV